MPGVRTAGSRLILGWYSAGFWRFSAESRRVRGRVAGFGRFTAYLQLAFGDPRLCWHWTQFLEFWRNRELQGAHEASQNDQNAKLYFQNVLGREKRGTILKSGRLFGQILEPFWSNCGAFLVKFFVENI